MGYRILRAAWPDIGAVLVYLVNDPNGKCIDNGYAMHIVLVRR